MTSLDEIKNRIRESLSETASFESGFSKIKSFDHGATRVVGIIQSGPYEGKVVKFPSHKRHIKTNLKELKTWNTYRGTDKEKYFVPIDLKASDNSGNYLVMEYADNSSGYTKDLGFESKSAFVDEFEHPDVTMNTVDLAPQNIALYKNKHRLIDYSWISC